MCSPGQTWRRCVAGQAGQQGLGWGGPGVAGRQGQTLRAARLRMLHIFPSRPSPGCSHLSADPSRPRRLAVLWCPTPGDVCPHEGKGSPGLSSYKTGDLAQHPGWPPGGRLVGGRWGCRLESASGAGPGLSCTPPPLPPAEGWLPSPPDPALGAGLSEVGSESPLLASAVNSRCRAPRGARVALRPGSREGWVLPSGRAKRRAWVV